MVRLIDLFLGEGVLETDTIGREAMAEKARTPEGLVEEIGSHDANKLLHILDEASKIQDKRIANFIYDYVAKDHQQHLFATGYNFRCWKTMSGEIEGTWRT